ncbi:MAG: hypothetical protein JO224_05250 [Pelomonas sp.]|nr:hypothetical protein [Roseateles sp.]
MSRNQLDKLGERLKAGDLGGDDLRMLDEYRRSFAATSSVVMQILRKDFGLAPTARPAKSTAAIVEKLRRLSTQLTRLQDIAGCRVVVKGLEHQQSLVVRLCQRFPDARAVDRVAEPSSGYRAMHVVVRSRVAGPRFRSGPNCSIYGRCCRRRWLTGLAMLSNMAGVMKPFVQGWWACRMPRTMSTSCRILCGLPRGDWRPAAMKSF